MIKRRMNDICCGVALTYGGEINLDYNCKYCLFLLQLLRTTCWCGGMMLLVCDSQHSSVL